MSELTTAERDVLNLKEEILQVINNMNDDRVLKATQDAIRKNAEPFTPGIFKFDESAAATLNGLKKQLGRAFAFYAEKDPFEAASGSKTSRTTGRKTSDGGVTAQDIISNLAKGRQ